MSLPGINDCTELRYYMTIDIANVLNVSLKDQQPARMGN